MLHISHTSPKRVLGHLRRLEREGEAILASVDQLTEHDEWRWDARVFGYLKKIVEDPDFIKELMLNHFSVHEMMVKDGLCPIEATREECDATIRKRVSQRLITLACFVEHVEAYIEQSQI